MDANRPPSSSDSLSSTGDVDMDEDLSILENTPPPPRTLLSPKESHSPIPSHSPIASPQPTTSLSSKHTALQDHPNHNEVIDPTDEDLDKGIIVNSNHNVVEMDTSGILVAGPDDDDYDEEEIIAPHHKRKRTSVNYILDGLDDTHHRRSSPAPRTKRRVGPKVRGVLIGVWRDSSEPNDNDKHVIYGFIDVHDRLRSRIYSMNKREEELIGNAPTGAGGCWVTFERVIFEPHLKGLNSAQLKEYVKLRTEIPLESTPEEKAQSEAEIVRRAIQLAEQEAMNPTPKPVLTRRSMGPRTNNTPNKPPKDQSAKQVLHKAPSFQAVNTTDVQSPQPPPFMENRPYGTLLGYWADSDEPNIEDKHAVFGVISETDSFRVKVQRWTRDGRRVEGNFPVGTGAMWIAYERVVLEPQLTGLTRAEIKEYCRIRQRQVAEGETERERLPNEQRAIRDAKTIIGAQGHGLNGAQPYHNHQTPNHQNGKVEPEPEIRHSARSEQKQLARQQAEAEAAASSRAFQEQAAARERQHEKTRKEVAAAEALVQEAAQQELKHNLKKLNKVWVAQQAAQMPSNGVSPAPSVIENEVRYHNGIKYERKPTGAFQGKLVSAPQILNIDGEDYVEYRVLTRPSFF